MTIAASAPRPLDAAQLCGGPGNATPEATRAVRELEAQCEAAGGAAHEVLRLLHGLAEYAGRGKGGTRSVNLGSAGYTEKLSRYPAARELLALLGFTVQEGEVLGMPPRLDVDPGVVCAINAGLLRTAGGREPVGAAVASVTPTSPLDERPTFLSPMARRHPLSNRLPHLAASLTTAAVLEDKAVISEKLRDGSSCVCTGCNGVIPVERFEMHLAHWCPAAGQEP